MKNYISITVTCLLFLLLAGCKKEATHTAFPSPTWQEDQTGKYPASMTAVVTMFYEMNSQIMPDDKMGAFINDECRGIGKIVKVSPVSTVFFILIHGTAAEQNKVKFKYYSAKSSYMYTTTEFLDFKIDTNYGTADHPETLQLRPID